MEFYYGLIVLLTLAWCLLCLPRRSKVKDRIYLVVAFGLLAAVSAARYCVGFDYWYVYAPQYDQLLVTPGYTFSDTRFEPGFVLLEMILARFSGDYHMLFVVTSILLMALFCIYYWRNSPNPFISVFLFLTLTQYYCTMDFIRQSIAAIILSIGMPLLKERKVKNYLLYLLLIGIAFTFHQSAVIMLAFLLINLLPVTNLFVLGGFSAVTAVLYFNTERIMAFVTQYVYKYYGGENIHVSTTFEPQFAIAMFCCFLLLFVGSKVLTARDKGNYLYVNYAFFAFFFVLMGTKHSILDRFSIYFIFSLPVGIALLMDSMGRKESGASIFAKGAQSLTYRKGAYLAVAVVVFGGSLCFHHFSLTRDHHGVLPYQVIWQQPFYSEYRALLQLAGDDEPDLLADSHPLDAAPTDLPELDFPGGD